MSISPVKSYRSSYKTFSCSLRGFLKTRACGRFMSPAVFSIHFKMVPLNPINSLQCSFKLIKAKWVYNSGFLFIICCHGYLVTVTSKLGIMSHFLPKRMSSTLSVWIIIHCHCFLVHCVIITAHTYSPILLPCLHTGWSERKSRKSRYYISCWKFMSMLSHIADASWQKHNT